MQSRCCATPRQLGSPPLPIPPSALRAVQCQATAERTDSGSQVHSSWVRWGGVGRHTRHVQETVVTSFLTRKEARMVAQDYLAFPDQPRTTHRPSLVESRLAEAGLPPLAILSQVMETAESDRLGLDTPSPDGVLRGRAADLGDSVEARYLCAADLGWTNAEPKNQPLAVALTYRLSCRDR